MLEVRDAKAKAQTIACERFIELRKCVSKLPDYSSGMPHHLIPSESG
jgi:hypothetical protein